MNKITNYLNQHLTGNVFDKASVLDAYSVDRSILKIKPRFVALPENTDDIRKIVRFVDQLATRGFRLPIAVRGSGLSQTGADLSSGIVISTEKLTKIQEIDPRDRLVRVESGVTLGELNAALALNGLTIPVLADPRETIGGLISNGIIDPLSQKYGGIANYIDRIEVVLANGDILQTAHLSRRALDNKKSLTNFEGVIYRDVDNATLDYADVLLYSGKNSFAGYPGIKKVHSKKPDYFDLFPLFYGAQGNLGIISEIILKCEVLPRESKHLVASFPSVRTAMDFLNFAKFLKPAEINLIDNTIINAVEEFGKRPTLLTRKLDEKGYIVIVNFNDRKSVVRKKIDKCIKTLPKSANPIIEVADNAGAFEEFNIAIISYLNYENDGERAPLINDFYIPKPELIAFVEDLTKFEEERKLSLPLYGSFATGIYHLRPDIDLTTEESRADCLQLLKDFDQLVKNHDGVLTGGSAEGRVKALISNYNLTDRERKLYRSIKGTFDPNNILNPDSKLGADGATTIKHLRTDYGNYIVI